MRPDDLPRPIHLAEDVPQFGPWDSGQPRSWDNLPEEPSSRKPFERLFVAETGAEIDINDDGTVFIASPDKKSIDAAKQWVKNITDDPEVGKIYTNCRVVSVLDFGAFVEILPGKEGLVHVSEMSEERVNSPSDVVKEGDTVTVKLVAIDDRGRLQLSMKAAARESK